MTATITTERAKIVTALSTVTTLKHVYPSLRKIYTAPYPFAVVRRGAVDWREALPRTDSFSNWDIIVVCGTTETLEQAIDILDTMIYDVGDATTSIKYALEHYASWGPEVSYCIVETCTGEEPFDMSQTSYVSTTFKIVLH